MLGQAVSGSDAAAWGMVHRAVPAEALEEEVRSVVDRLAVAPTVTIGLTKWLLHAGSTTPLPEQLQNEALAMELSSRSEDFREGLTAFMEKRPPDSGAMSAGTGAAPTAGRLRVGPEFGGGRRPRRRAQLGQGHRPARLGRGGATWRRCRGPQSAHPRGVRDVVPRLRCVGPGGAHVARCLRWARPPRRRGPSGGRGVASLQPGPPEPPGIEPGCSGAFRPRQRGAAAALSASHRAQRGDVVSALQRAGLGIRLGVARHAAPSATAKSG